MINTYISVQKEWVAGRGFNNVFTITFTLNGSAFNISAYTFAVAIRRIGGETNVLSLTQASGITNGGATGILTIQVTEANSETIDADSYFYSIDYTVGGLFYSLFHGTFNLLKEYNPNTINNSVTVPVSLAGTAVSAEVTLAADANVIHTNVSGEINSVSEKAIPIGADLILIEDSEDSNAKKKVQIDNLPDSFATAEHSTTLTFNKDKEIYFDATGQSPVYTLSGSGNLNGVGIILRLNKPTAVTFPANFEAHPNSATLDATKLNVYTLVFFTDWDGLGTDRVIYTNSLFTAI